MLSDTEYASRPEIRKLGELIKGIKVAMLVTAEPGGTLRGRPMMTQEIAADGTLWFFTRIEAPKTSEIRADAQIQVTYMDPDKNRYVSVSGNADIVRDQAKIQELWTEDLKAWFPGGRQDPGVALIKVNATQAEYWDTPSGAMGTLRGLATKVTGGNPEPKGPRLHDKVTL